MNPKTLTNLLPCLLALACAAPDTDSNPPALGVAEEGILLNQTNGGAFRIPGTLEGPPGLAANQYNLQAMASATTSGQFWVPNTKTLKTMIDPVSESSLLRSMATAALQAINADANTHHWSGTSFSLGFMPAGYNPDAPGEQIPLHQRLWIVNDCSSNVGNTALPSTDIRRYYSVFRWGNWNQLSEPSPGIPGSGTYWQTDGETEIKVNGCRIASLVGGTGTTAYQNVYKHALSQGIRVAKVGQGVIGCGSPALATCAQVDSSMAKLNAASWQNCLVKTMNVTNSPGQIKITSAFQCPTPPAGH